MNNKQEAKFSTKFRLWAKKNMPMCVIELKHTRGKDKFTCSELKEHQYWSLLAANTSSLAYKIPDDGMGSKPFDMIILKKIVALVVIKYPKGTAAISIKNWNIEWKTLTFEQAVFIGFEINI